VGFFVKERCHEPPTFFWGVATFSLRNIVVLETVIPTRNRVCFVKSMSWELTFRLVPDSCDLTESRRLGEGYRCRTRWLPGSTIPRMLNLQWTTVDLI